MPWGGGGGGGEREAAWAKKYNRKKGGGQKRDYTKGVEGHRGYPGKEVSVLSLVMQF